MINCISVNDKEVYLLGTAHVSKQSAEDVITALNEINPDTVCVELCDARLDAISNPDAWKKTDLFSLIKQGKSYVLLAQLVLTSYQKRIAEKLGVRPGEEMRTAVSETKSRGLNLSVVDRNIKVTLRRAWNGAGIWGITKLFFSGLFSFFSDSKEVTEEEIERMKNADILQELVSEFGENLPGAKKALIDERDIYMAQKIREAPGKKVLAVLGAGHLEGISKLIDKDQDISALEKIPKARFSTKLLAYGLPAFVVGLIAWGFIDSGAEFSFSLIMKWVLFNGALSALGTIIAGASILTVLAAFVAAPFTSLNPMIAAGWVAGLVETWKKRPVVEDFESLSDDITTFRGFRRNQITRILLVVAFANLGSSIGSILAAGSIASSIWG